MPEEQRGPQNMALKGTPWYLCKQSKAARKQGWIPELGWNFG